MIKLEKYSKKFGKVIIIYVLAWFILFFLSIYDFTFYHFDILFGPHDTEPWGFTIGILLMVVGLPILVILSVILIIFIILKK